MKTDPEKEEAAKNKKPNPATKQDQQPGIEAKMQPKPDAENPEYKGCGKLMDKVALITGGDSGIGKAAAIAFAKDGADIVITYLNEHEDAKQTVKEIEAKGRRCLAIAGDISQAEFATQAIDQTITKFGKLDILVNNAGVQFPKTDILEITDEQLQHTFAVNIFSYFYFVKAALPHLKPGSAIINTTSVTAYKGSKHLIDYSATKGAIVAFTRSLSQSLIEKQINVNGVAPGPIWTPLIPASFNEEEIEAFGKNVPMQRVGQPEEVAACYVFLACDDSSYMTGQVLHPNGGVIVNG